MENLLRMLTSFIITVFCLLFMGPVYSEAADRDHTDKTEIIVTDDPCDVALSTENAEPLHKGQVIIDTATGDVKTESGDSETLREVFGISPKTQKELLSAESQENKENIEHYLREEGLYQVDGSEEDALTVTFPYVYKRIMVFAKEGALKNTYGADKVSYFLPAGEYILDYSTENAAKEACDALIADHGKDCVMPDIPIHLYAEAFSETTALSDSWGNDMMHLDEIRDRVNTDSSMTATVKVAVLDTGIYQDHELFAGRLEKGGRNFINEGLSIADEQGHGTHVAGIIADGTPRQVRILPLKVLNNLGEGGFGELINGIYYAVTVKADVINMSMGVSLKDYGEYWKNIAYNTMENVLKYAYDSGCLCVVAAGNEHSNLDENGLAVYPAISRYTITVSSMTRNRQRSVSSNYGNSVDFTAPGEGIVSASITGADNYKSMSGTSMAAPHVTAACALLRLYNKNSSDSDIIQALKSMAVDLGTSGRDLYFGNGLIVFECGKVPVLGGNHASAVNPSSQNVKAVAAPSAPTTQSKNETITVIKGKSYKVSGQTYKVTKKAGASSFGTVTFMKGNNAKSVKIPDKVRLADKKLYKITAINPRAFTAGKIRTVTIGANVKKINKNAFSGSKAVKLIIKTRLLKKSAVKGSLKGSRIRTIQIKAGNRKTNKKYIRLYKKLFTKKISGARVFVR